MQILFLLNEGKIDQKKSCVSTAQALGGGI